jgi:hypothetical protein
MTHSNSSHFRETEEACSCVMLRQGLSFGQVTYALLEHNSKQSCNANNKSTQLDRNKSSVKLHGNAIFTLS